MSWTLTGHPKTQKITKSLAEKFANMDPAPHDRPLSEIRLKVYEKIIVAGGFRPVDWAAAFCKQTGSTYRVNGKHTATLTSGMDLDAVQDLYAVVSYYECDTLEDVARLYSTYDSKTQSRTVNDINQSFASCVPQLEGVDSRTINLCTGAIWYSSILETYKHMQQAERAEALLEHHDFVVWVYELLGRNTSSKSKVAHLKRMPVIAAMYSTWNRAPLVAKRFWEAVRDETGARPEEPTRKLAKFLLLNSTLNMRGDGKPGRYRVKEREFFVKSLHAWNAYRTDEPTNLSYTANAKPPVVK